MNHLNCVPIAVYSGWVFNSERKVSAFIHDMVAGTRLLADVDIKDIFDISAFPVFPFYKVADYLAMSLLNKLAIQSVGLIKLNSEIHLTRTHS